MIGTNRSFDESGAGEWKSVEEEQEEGEYGPQKDRGLVTTNGGTVYFL
jgi:hypothetical protein